jgi:hypothetical protein
MRRSALTAVLASVVVLGPAAPALAHPTVALDPTLPSDVTFSSTDNVEHLGRFPEHTGTASGRPSDDGKLFYLTDPRGVYVYDTTDPADPQRLGSLPLFQTTTGAALAQEDVDTDGEILLVDAATTPAATRSLLQVVDVSDPANLKVLSSVAVTDHTWTCVTGVADDGGTKGCAYAYGRTGHIVDLTDPTTPVLLPETWRQAVGYGARSNSPYTHDLTEIRPGLVMSSGVSAVVMDTTDPAAPIKLAELGANDRARFSSLGYHSVEWARGGRDRFVVLGTEIAPPPVAGLPSATQNTAGSDCEGENSVIETWDARGFLAAMKAYEVDGDPGVFAGEMFTRVDTYDATGRGLFVTGQAVGSQLYCAHWMSLHPKFKNGGLMAVAYYNRGTRFVEVGKDGMMTETGWITPAEGYTGSPQWVSQEIVYVMDYRRGLEIVRLAQDQKATKVKKKDKDSTATASVFELPSGPPLGGEQLAWAALALLAVGLWRAERVVRRREGTLATA